jgi:hypothetical protein
MMFADRSRAIATVLLTGSKRTESLICAPIYCSLPGFAGCLRS